MEVIDEELNAYRRRIRAKAEAIVRELDDLLPNGVTVYWDLVAYDPDTPPNSSLPTGTIENLRSHVEALAEELKTAPPGWIEIE